MTSLLPRDLNDECKELLNSPAVSAVQIFFNRLILILAEQPDTSRYNIWLLPWKNLEMGWIGGWMFYTDTTYRKVWKWWQKVYIL